MASTHQAPADLAATPGEGGLSQQQGKNKTEHHFGRGFSDNTPIPTIQTYLVDKAREHKSRQTAEEAEDGYEFDPDDTVDNFEPAEEEEEESQKQAKEKDEIMKRMGDDEQKPTDRVKKRKGHRRAHDPTTGQPVLIKDAIAKDYPGPNSYASLQPAPEERAVHPSRISPSPAGRTNISLQPYPPPAPVELQPILAYLDRLGYLSIAGTFLLWIFFAFGGGWWKFIWCSTLLGALGTAEAALAWGATRKLEKQVDQVRLNMHRERGETFSPPFPESAEWLNALLSCVWGLMNPDLFLSTVDMVEDIMQASLPSFVDAVRISDIGQGTNHLRVLSIRGLPDKPGDKKYPRKDWIDQGRPPPKNPNEYQYDQTGSYTNLEVAFAYSALPGNENKLMARNIHLLIEFFVGFFGWFNIPIPVWVQVESVVGTARLRVQIIPDPPFIRTVQMSLMGVPAVEISVTPMARALPNILDLPLLSRFVRLSIAAGMAEFVAPKSLTINVQDLLSDAEIGDIHTVGVFIVTIHYGDNLSVQDRSGSSDPYIVLAFAKFGKPQYSTRIILQDLNPVFEETCALLLSHDDVQEDEELSLMLWDSDKYTSDDLIGRVQIPVKELMQEPNVMRRRTDDLKGFEDADSMQGKLHWSVGYYEKVPPEKELEIPEDHSNKTLSKTLPEMEMRPGDQAPNPAAKDGPPPPPNLLRTPPNPAFLSGILSIYVHQINNLERANLKGTSGRQRESQTGQTTDKPDETSSNLPSSFCEVIVNDDLVYKTRIKQFSSMPIFQAGTELFIRNWQSTVVRIVVRDSALREKDPVLGVIEIHLNDIFQTASEVTRKYPLEKGIGYGKAKISLLFQPVKLQLPPNMQGWDTGTVELTAPVEVRISSSHTSLASNLKSLRLSTTDSIEKLPAKLASHGEDGSLRWDLEEKCLRLPVYSRMQSRLTFELMGSSLGGGKLKAIAVVWLQELVDDEERLVTIPILVGDNLEQLRQNYLNEFTRSTHKYEIAGFLTTRVKLDPGLDEDHESHAETSARRHAFEAFDLAHGVAELSENNAHVMDDGVIDKEEARNLKKAEHRQNAHRHRGVYEFKPYRTLVWMKDGVKRRIIPKPKTNKRDPTVKTEA